LGGESVSEHMSPAAFVIDTQTLVWFVKGRFLNLSRRAFLTLVDPRARVVIPSFVLQEIQDKFPYDGRRKGDISIPPTALLRILHRCSNVRILPRGVAVLAREFELHRLRKARKIEIDAQDVQIAAAVLVVRDYHRGSAVLVTSDGRLARWASATSITVVRS